MSRLNTFFSNTIAPAVYKLGSVAIDLGSYKTKIMAVTESEPRSVASCMVLSKENQTVVSIGEEAREIVGRNSSELEVFSPVKESFFTDFQLSRLFLQYCFSQLVSGDQKQLNVVPQHAFFFVAPSFSEVQYRAIRKICREIGVHSVDFLIQPMIASLSPQLKRLNPQELRLFIDCGYESTHFSILQFEKVFSFHQMWYGGKDLTQSIQAFLRTKHHLEVGTQTAERVKQEVAGLLRLKQPQKLKMNDEKSQLTPMIVVRGRDIITSFPKSIKVSVEELRPHFEQFVTEILDELNMMIERFGPELVEEVIHKGFSVFGGMSVVNLLVEKIEEQYGTVVHRPTQPDLIYFEGFKEYLQCARADQKKYQFVGDFL
jgi:rod shape-determining protein MreB